MIPKIIHYCWFGKKDKPQSVLDYIKGWKEICIDYEIKEWNENNFDVNKYLFTKEAYKMKKFAFVSDVCRLYALINYGGIYLDTDVEVKKSFDDLLSLRSFLGKEMPFKLSTAVIGAEKNVDWIKDFLATYDNKHFIRRLGKLNTLENTALLTTFFNHNYPKYFDNVSIFDIDFFCAKLFSNGEYCISNNTYAIHHYFGSWIKKKDWGQRIKALLCRNLK